MALWLTRADPPNVEVVAERRGAQRRWAVLPNSDAPIGTFGAPLFGPAHGKSSLRETFCDWLVGQHGWTKHP